MSPLALQARYHHENRTATWLELFFDLVFVVVVAKVTHLLAHSHDGHLEPGIWRKFPLMLLPTWWIWMVHTTWSKLHDADGKVHRAASLFVMLQMVALSMTIVTDRETAYPLFTAAYFGLRLAFAALFLTFVKDSSRRPAAAGAGCRPALRRPLPRASCAA